MFVSRLDLPLNLIQVVNQFSYPSKFLWGEDKGRNKHGL